MINEADAPRTLGHLERLGTTLGVEIRYEPLGEENDTVSIKSGLCVVKDLPVIIIDNRLSMVDRAKALAGALSKFDLTSVFIPPAIRQLLEDTDK